MKKHIILLSLLLLILTILLSLMIGSVVISPIKLFESILSSDSFERYIFFYSRLPRTIACVFAGGALAVAGAILQSVLANNLAAPGIIGVNSGAGLAVTLSCAIGVSSGLMMSLSAFIGAIITSLFIMVVSARLRASRTTVLLCGVSMNYILGALSDTLVNLVPSAAMNGSDFFVGGFSSVSAIRLYPATIIIFIAIALACTLTNELEILSLGDDEAISLGVNVKRLRALFIILSSLLAGSAVSFAGLLGFVGLLVPNATRRILKRDRRYYILLSAILGGIIVTLCDIIARSLFRPYELAVGIIMSLLGGPVFLYLVLKRRRA